jgi:DNA-directed RNA polymerase subunit RPC12/RpoP
MLYLKSCARCGGDVAASGDVYGRYLGCLSCGHMIDVPANRAHRNARAAKKASAKAAA